MMLLIPIWGSGCGGGSSNDQGSKAVVLPPDPGAVGKTTLQGIDTDTDGVRDDVQIAIYNRYPSDESKRKALTQKAKALQAALSAGESEDINTMVEASKAVINAVDCLHERVSDPSAEIGFLEDKVVNTSDRSGAYIKFNESQNGQFFGDGDDDSPCQ